VSGIIKRLPTLLRESGISNGEPFWADCKRRIDDGAVTPIVSNRFTAALWKVEPCELAKEWAEDIGCPLPIEDSKELARVAQFHSVRQRDSVEAKRQYLEALKGYLVALALDNGDVDRDLVEEFSSVDRRSSISFSDLARKFGYPRYPNPTCNPMRLLAELPLPIYLTTCHHRFLEHAILQAGSREPMSEIFYWHDGLKRIPSVLDQWPDYEPSKERPLVYHLFGLDDYPESLVLSEDDYLDYLIRLSSLSYEVKYADRKMGLPDCVSIALNSTALLLLGYDVYDWDFRVLFKGLIQIIANARKSHTPKGIVVQLEPTADGDPDKQQEIKGYLSEYFDQSHFAVYWGDIQSCVHRIWQLWKGS